MSQQKRYLVFGASGQTGRHFVSLALAEGHRVRAVVRNPAKLALQSPNSRYSREMLLPGSRSWIRC